MLTMAKRRICTVAPAPYHQGPLIPNLYATALLCNCAKPSSAPDDEKNEDLGRTSVAAHVQAETIPEAINPGLILLDAVLNSSESLGENGVYRA